jgi:hypothetical protein
VRNNTRENHIQIDIHKASSEMPTRLDSCCVVAIFPKSAFALLAIIVFLSGAPCYQLHAPGNHAFGRIFYQQMDMI